MNEKIKKLTPTAKILLGRLHYKYKYFFREGKLDSEGFFYYSNERLADEIGCSVKTIKRAKTQLIEGGFIYCIQGEYKGVATRYRVNLKGDKKYPFGQYVKGDNFSPKGDKVSDKGIQKVPPNKEIINEINKEGELMEDPEPQTFKNQKLLNVLVSGMGIDSVKKYIAEGVFTLEEGVSLEKIPEIKKPR